ncbi:YtxH domain-containing protein [Pontibacter sp. H249]|uniref:YtxH domain-containing protein n=1 Tax=Pontibacter sp. H249 TaxID=3133420 RepID=UPI0030C44CF5
MRTKMETRSLGEERSTYNTNSSVRQMRQQTPASKRMKGSSGNATGAVALGLLAGAAAGAIAGILMAPDKGTATRKKVSDSASKWGDQLSKGYSATKSKVESWTGKKEPYKNPNLSKNQPGSTTAGSSTTGAGGTTASTGANKNWDDTEVNRMINDSRKTPGL